MRLPSFRNLSAGKRAIAAVIPHTHWDRAWYHPAEQFRLSLCKVFRRLLDILEQDKRYRCFTFDGQTVVLEDHLELYPSDRPRIRRLVAAGRLTFGPFYVLPDFFLPTPESLIRNGAIGQEIAESFGRSSRQGYVADPFGLVSQTPQIFARLGLQSVFFSRGVSREQFDRLGSTFRWRAPDGSEILAVLQINGYSNLMNWGVPVGAYPHKDPDTPEVDWDASSQQVAELLKAYEKAGCRSHVLFFGNGNDHHGPQHRMPDLLAYNARRFPDVAFVITDTDGFIDLVRQERPRLGVAIGELHAEGQWRTLNGTLENRPYLKQQYDTCADWIERRAEPFCAIADRLALTGRVFREAHHAGYAFNAGNNAGLAQTYPAEALRYAWKTLLRNAPHDDICGCSDDATHRDAENRAKRVVEVASLLASDATLRIAQRVRPPSAKLVAQIVVFNGLGFDRRCPVCRTMTVPAHSARLRLLDHRGRAVAAHVTARIVGKTFRRWHSHAFENLPAKAVAVTVSFLADVPAVGYACYFLQEWTGESAPLPSVGSAKNPRSRGWLRVHRRGMENGLVRVRLRPDGSLDVFDKRNGVWYRALNRLRDEGDAGGAYVSRLLGDGRYAAPSAMVQLVEQSPERIVFRARVRIPAVPLGLAPDRKSRAGATRPLTVGFLYTLYAHSPVVHIRAEWINRHRDHRLTVEFPSPFRTRSTQSQSAFDVIEHTAPFRQASCRDFVTVAEGRRRLTVLSRSMRAYDGQLTRSRLVLGKTLLKAAGCLAPELLPQWQAPEGNCLGPVVQEYAILAGDGRDSWSDLARAAEDFVHAPFVEHLQPCPTGDLPARQAFVTVESPLCLTAVKRCEERDSLLIRAVNLSAETEQVTIALAPLLNPGKAYCLDLRERRTTPIQSRNGAVRLHVRPREIVSIEWSRQ